MAWRVLIVEDEALIAWNLEMLVTGLGYEVVGPAATFAEALAAAGADPPHIALVDLNLADGMTGPHVARELASRHDAVVVAVTGNPDCVEAGRDGVQRVVGKPVSDDMVRDVLEWAVEIASDSTGRGERGHRGATEATV